MVRFRRCGDDVDTWVVWLLKAGPSTSDSEAEAGGCCVGPGDGSGVSREADMAKGIMARRCPNKVPLLEKRDLKTGEAEIGGARQLNVAVWM